MSFWDAVKTEDEILDSTELRSEFRNEKMEVRDSILNCCRDKVEVGITITGLNRIHPGRFIELVGNTITFELDEANAQVPLLSTCMVSYFHEGKAHLFLSMVRDLHVQENSPAQLFLRLPEQVAVSQVRWSFRVPMEGLSEFSLEVRDEQGRCYSPLCRDISFGGLKAEFSEYEDPDLQPGDLCDLTMNYLGKELLLKAEVRHRRGHVYGLYLPQTFENGQFSPPEVYRWIVNALEKRCY